MLRTTIGTGINITKQLSLNEWIGINSTFSQIIRWKRKPIWLPPAKSKLFRVTHRKKSPEEELIEIKRLFNNYRTYRTAIKYHLMDVIKANTIEFDEEFMRNEEEKDFNRCMELNNQWNNEVKKIRDERLAKEDAERRIMILNSVNIKKQLKKERMEMIEQKVRKAKIESETFITKDNIDQAINEALANIINYNTAIDLNGNVYEGNIVDVKTVEQNIQ